ncbi:MAG: glycosyltransferase, partial [Ferruginibacter sp.]
LIEKKITTLIFQGDNMTTALQVQRAAANAGCKAILHYHGSPFGYLKKYIYKTDILMNPFLIFKLIWAAILYPFKKIKLQKVINNAEDGFVCVSYGAANEIHAIYNLKQTVSSNIKTIHNPLTFKPAESVNNFEHKKKIIVYISRLHRKHKNSMLVLKAWQKIEKENPDWQLQIIGDGQLKNKMIKYVEDDKIKNVLFTGMVNNVDEFLIQSSISVLSSDCEGLGMGLLESAVYRNAIVATKSDGGVVDIVEDHITGYLVPRNNSLLFAEKLQDLISDKNTRERMGNSLYEKMQGFSDEKILAEWKLLLT